MEELAEQQQQQASSSSSRSLPCSSRRPASNQKIRNHGLVQMAGNLTGRYVPVGAQL